MVVGHAKSRRAGRRALSCSSARPASRKNFARGKVWECLLARMHAFARYKTAPKRLREAIS